MPTDESPAPPARVTVIVNAGNAAATESLVTGQRGVPGEPLEVLVGGDDWIARGVEQARGEVVVLVDSSGVGSPHLLATVLAAVDAYDDPVVSIAVLELPEHHGEGAGAAPKPAEASLVDAANPERLWFDPRPRGGLALPVEAARRALRGLRGVGTPLDLDALAVAAGGTPITVVGEALVNLHGQPPQAALQAGGLARTREGGSRPPENNPRVRFMGPVFQPQLPLPLRTPGFRRRERPRLSVVVVVHDMAREAPRTLASLLPPYQRGASPDDYEVVVVENGSTAPLDPERVRALAPGVDYLRLDDPPPSPAYAINRGVRQTTGDLVGIVIDGACLHTPGVIEGALRASRVFPAPVVGVRYFMLGPGLQRESIARGYDAAEEDRLLASIRWPEDGHRLFEIGSPLTFGGPTEHWLTTWFESNCLFVPRAVFEELGGFDERFDFPGGGLANLDFFRRACELPHTTPVQLVGEGVFHQVHGGITTNADQADVDRKNAAYHEQYATLRGREAGGPDRSFWFLGSLPNAAARSKMRG